VDETGRSLGRIVAHVTQINAVVSEIAASAQEQARGLAEVNTAINQMDQVTQQNAAMVEQSTAASQSLARETEALVHLTKRFHVGQATDDADAATNVEPLRQAAMKPAPRSPKAKIIRYAGQGRGQSEATARIEAQEGWEEF
jgi:methyl-accepting chemotaxis protein